MAEKIGGLGEGGEADKAARDGVPKYDTPFRDCVPPLTKKEYSVLKASICEEGLFDAIIIDECNNILDGHHRYRACLELGIVPSVRTRAGLGSDSAKRVFVRGLAGKGRNLQAKQLKQVHESQKEDCRRLRQEDSKTWTLEKLAAMSGVDRSTVGKWCSNGSSPIGRPDARRKLTLEDERAAKSAIDAGESLSEVAKRYGVSKSRMGQIKSKQVVSTGESAGGVTTSGGNILAKKDGRDGGAKSHAQRTQQLEDEEMEELINEGEDHLRMAMDALYGFPDSVLIAALQEVFGDWVKVAGLQDAEEQA